MYSSARAYRVDVVRHFIPPAHGRSPTAASCWDSLVPGPAYLTSHTMLISLPAPIAGQLVLVMKLKGKILKFCVRSDHLLDDECRFWGTSSR